MQSIGDYGPKMKALPNDNWREFATLYCQQGGKDAMRAYALAFDHDMNDPAKKKYCAVAGHRLAHDSRMLDAILELSERAMRSLAPLATNTFRQVLENKVGADSDKINAAKAVADRVGLHARTEHKLTVEHIDNPERLARLADLAGRLGVDLAGMVGSRLAVKAPVIDLTPTSITVANEQQYVDDEY